MKENEYDVIEEGQEVPQTPPQQMQGGVSFDPQMVAMAQALVQQIAPNQAPTPQQQAWVDPLEDPAVNARLDELQYSDPAAYRRETTRIAREAAIRELQPQMMAMGNQGFVEQQLMADLSSIAFDPADIPALQVEARNAIAMMRNQNPALFANPQDATKLAKEYLDGKAAQIARARMQNPNSKLSSIPPLVASSRDGTRQPSDARPAIPAWAVALAKEQGATNIPKWYERYQAVQRRGGNS